MDVQLKRGILDVCVLAALLQGESYGYQIVQDLAGHGIEISESTLYPILRRLEAAGCLSEDSRAHNGRLRKYYRMTDAGRERINGFLEEWKTVMNVYTFIETEMGSHEADE